MHLPIRPLVLAVLASATSAQNTLLVPEQFATIQGAIAAAGVGDTVSVGPGVHAGFHVNKAIAVRSRLGPDATFIDASTTAGEIGVRFNPGATRDTVVDGFTIQLGLHGIQVWGSSPTIRNCKLRYNVSWGDGAGLQSTDGAPWIENCVFSNNQSDFSGSAIFIGPVPAGETAVVLNSTVTRNNSWVGDPFGAVTIRGAAYVVNSVIWNNLNAPDLALEPDPGGIVGTASFSNYSGADGQNGNTDLDPEFVNANNDFRLRATSPLRERGTHDLAALIGPPSALPTLDFDGFPRWLGAAPDMGAYEFRLGTQYCFGDGSSTPCPCGNAGAKFEGCMHGGGRGGTLSAAGTASVSGADLVLWAHGLLASKAGLFFQGSGATAGGAGIAFGDGLRCAGGAVRRLEVAFPDSSGSMHTSVPLAAAGGVSSGQVCLYQVWYRDPVFSPCASGFNWTNGLEVVWIP